MGPLDDVPHRAPATTGGRVELDRPHQAPSAHVADDLVALDQRPGQLEQQLAQPCGALNQSLTVDHRQRRERGSGREIVAAEGRAVAHTALHTVEHAVTDRRRHEDPTDRREAARERLRDADDVGVKAPVLEREEAPGASEPRLHLVADEQRAVLAAGLLRAGEIALRGQVDALALDRLDDEGGDVLARELAPQRLEIAVGDPVAAWQQRPEAGAELLVAVERDRKSTRLNSSHLGISYA